MKPADRAIRTRDRAPALRKGQFMRNLAAKMESSSGATFIKLAQMYADLAGFRPPKKARDIEKATESEAEMIVRMEEELKRG